MTKDQSAALGREKNARSKALLYNKGSMTHENESREQP
jgi:hypothetical protein